mgnify:CR=1 FL=1
MSDYYIYVWFNDDWGGVPFYIGMGQGRRFCAKSGRSIAFTKFINRWNCSPLILLDGLSEETAKGLGVNVGRTRLLGMIAASLISAIVVAFLGVIGFVGLVCPHMMRRIVGDDHRFLIPASVICGALLLLAADTVARTIIAPQVLPVAVLTSFLGAPIFIYLIIKGRRV